MDPRYKRETFERGITCFNCGQFFECHELLEEIWLAEAPGEKLFYQGLIQVAAGFHHYQRGNLDGAHSLIRQGAEKLAAYPPKHDRIDLAGLRAALLPWLESLSRGQQPTDLAPPRIQPAP